MCFKKVQKLKKKVWLKPTAELLFCLRGFDRNLPQLMTAALYLPYVQGLFTMTNNGNFTTCTCSMILHMHEHCSMCDQYMVCK